MGEVFFDYGYDFVHHCILSVSVLEIFFLEYDRHTLRTSPPWGSELLEAINSLKKVDSTALLQFLHPILNMLLHLIGNGGETLEVAAFRAMVNILTRVQQESVDEAERNIFLVNYVNYAFDDFGGQQTPVYPGLSTVWGSLARSKAKGYRVAPVYDDVPSMAWFFLVLIVKSMALEQTRLMYHNLPLGEDIPPMQLKEGVFRCIMQLYDCLLTEAHERCKRGLSLAKRLNSSLAFFCYDLLSTIEPRQVFELVSLYMDTFSGVCQSVLHDCKLTFLQIICDHDLFVEMPGRDPSDRLAIIRNEKIRKRAVIGLQILVRSSFSHFTQTEILRAMLTITLSELMSEVQVTQMKSDGTLEESGEARRLRKSLEEMADESKSQNLIKDCRLPETSLVDTTEGSVESRWSWSEVKFLSNSLLLALDASMEHALC